MDRELTEKEKKFLRGAAKRKSLFLISSVATVIVAVSFLVYHGLIIRDMNGLRFVIILLLLLSGRSYLRLYKSAVIFSKLRNADGQGDRNTPSRITHEDSIFAHSRSVEAPDLRGTGAHPQKGDAIRAAEAAQMLPPRKVDG